MIEIKVRTGWLAFIGFAVLGIFLLFYSYLGHRLSILIPGSLIILITIGAFIAFSWNKSMPLQNQVGILILALSLSWGTITLLSRWFLNKTIWWPLIPGTIIGSLSACLLFSPATIVDFSLYGVIGIGVVLLGWGIFSRLFGLIIPGSLLMGIGPGIYTAWRPETAPNGLVQTGIMLVWFALGWGLLVILSRLVTDKFIWWPLIPGGVLAIVGWSLFIGGNPRSAISFIGNSSSIGIILIGLYLLLLRNGIRK